MIFLVPLITCAKKKFFWHMERLENLAHLLLRLKAAEAPKKRRQMFKSKTMFY